MIELRQAIRALKPTASFSNSVNGYSKIIWHSEDIEKPTEAECDAKLAELQAAEPMRLLRVERNSRLDVTDWWASSDLVMSNERQIYRQQLRDLPATASPTLDESGQLSCVTWSEIPE